MNFKPTLRASYRQLKSKNVGSGLDAVASYMETVSLPVSIGALTSARMSHIGSPPSAHKVSARRLPTVRKQVLAIRMLERLDLERAVPRIKREILGSLVSPVETPVLSALGQPEPSTDTWTVRDPRYSEAQIVEAHMAWLDERPEIVRAGMAKLRGRIDSVGRLESEAGS